MQIQGMLRMLAASRSWTRHGMDTARELLEGASPPSTLMLAPKDCFGLLTSRTVVE